MIRILVFGHTLQNLVDDSEFEIEQDGPVTVQALLEGETETMSPLVPLLKRGEILVTVNKKVGALHSIVQNGDTVKLTHNVTHAFDGPMWQNP